jgi:hypothetical protein
MYLKYFYLNNKIDIDEISSERLTANFETALKNRIKYHKAKIVDIYDFSKGKNNQRIYK